MGKFADLHIHTFYSDSTLSPEEVLYYADKSALSAIAICDHDSVDGIGFCKEIGDKTGIEVIAGLELTVEKTDAEIHLLGYCIDAQAGWLKEKLKGLQEARLVRVHKMVEKLENSGIKLDPAEVIKSAGKGSVGRMHVAQAMLKTGKVKSFKEIFGKYIGFMKSCYVPSVKLTPEDAIKMVLDAGGVPVVAHPVTMGNDEYIRELVTYGLRGIEVYHTDHRPSDIKRYEDIAKEHSLLMTGGSDCHGMGKGRVMIGTVRIPYDLVEKLKKESESIRNERR